MDVDELRIDMLKTVPVDFGKLCNAADNDVLKKTVYYKFLTKVNAIDTSRFALKTQNSTNKPGLEKRLMPVRKKIPETCVLVKKQIIMQ